MLNAPSRQTFRCGGERLVEIRRLSKRSSLGENIASQLYEAILYGGMKPGDPLPGQRELAERLGASTATLREGISILVAAGILSAQPGKGTVIRSIEDGGDQFHGWLGAPYDESEVFELIEARLVLERHFAMKAAGSATPSQIAQLTSCVASMRENVADPEAYLAFDVEFHRLFARCARNRILTRIVRALELLIIHMCRPANRRHIEDHGDLSVSVETHQALVDAIASGDERSAVACLETMAERTRTTFQALRAQQSAEASA